MSSPPPPSDRLSDYFKFLAAVSPPALKVWAATGEPEFAAAVGEALDDALRRIQAEPGAAAQPPGLPRQLVQRLCAASVPSGAEAGPDGQVSVTVKHPAELAFTVRRSLGPR